MTKFIAFKVPFGALSTMRFLSEFPKTEAPSETLDDKLLLSETETTQGITKTRKVNIWPFFIFGALVLVSLSLISYTLYHSDINRLKGYDECVNIWEGSGADYTENASECKPPNFNTEFSNFICTLVISSFLPFVLTLLLAAGFRYAPSITVLGVLVIFWGYLVVAPFLLFEWISSNVKLGGGVFYIIGCAIIICIIVMLCLMVYERNRFKMTLILFKESSMALSDIKMLPWIPIRTLHMVAFVVIISGVNHMYMSTAGILRYMEYAGMVYVSNGLMIAAIVLNVVLTAWIVQIMLGLQNMAISSAVSKWYSSRGPVATDFWTTLKSRLESAFLGPIVINLASVPRSILIALSQISIMKDMMGCFLRYLNGFHYSYIFIASQGTSFFESSKKARQMLNLNVGHATGIKYLGSFVMFLCPVLVSGLSIVFYCSSIEGSYYYNFNFSYTMFPYYFVAIISFLFSYTLLAPIQVAYDTLYMCACEDILKGGHQRNSISIKEFHRNAAEVLGKKIRETSELKTTLDDVV